MLYIKHVRFNTDVYANKIYECPYFVANRISINYTTAVGVTHLIICCLSHGNYCQEQAPYSIFVLFVWEDWSEKISVVYMTRFLLTSNNRWSWLSEKFLSESRFLRITTHAYNRDCFDFRATRNKTLKNYWSIQDTVAVCYIVSLPRRLVAQFATQPFLVRRKVAWRN